MNIYDPPTPWRLFVIMALVILVYGYCAAATYKATKYRLGETDNRLVATIFWPVYWTWRGVDKLTWWAEPSWASGPE